MTDVKLGSLITKQQERDAVLVVLKTQAIADELFEATVARRIRLSNVDRDHAVESIRKDIGYWAGHYGDEARERCERLYGAVHPYLGSVSNARTPEEILEIGKQLGEKIRNAGNTA